MSFVFPYTSKIASGSKLILYWLSNSFLNKSERLFLYESISEVKGTAIESLLKRVIFEISIFWIGIFALMAKVSSGFKVLNLLLKIKVSCFVDFVL